MKIPCTMLRLKGYRFPREIVAYAVWAYHRFARCMADPQMSRRYREQLGNLIETMNMPEHRAEASEIVRSLIEKIVLTLGSEPNSQHS